MIWEYIHLIFISMVPIIELRGAIPVGIVQGLNPIYVYISCVIGAIIPAPFLIIFFKDLLKWLKKNKHFKWVGDFLDNKVNKNSDKIMKKKLLGIILFVGIPLPTTGTWTAAMVASVFKMRIKDAVLGIIIGNMLAGVIVSFITLNFT